MLVALAEPVHLVLPPDHVGEQRVGDLDVVGVVGHAHQVPKHLHRVAAQHQVVRRVGRHRPGVAERLVHELVRRRQRADHTPVLHLLRGDRPPGDVHLVPVVDPTPKQRQRKLHVETGETDAALTSREVGVVCSDDEIAGHDHAEAGAQHRALACRHGGLGAVEEPVPHELMPPGHAAHAQRLRQPLAFLQAEGLDGHAAVVLAGAKVLAVAGDDDDLDGVVVLGDGHLARDLDVHVRRQDRVASLRPVEGDLGDVGLDHLIEHHLIGRFFRWQVATVTPGVVGLLVVRRHRCLLV